MGKTSFNERWIETRPIPKEKRVTYYDEKTSGLRLQIQPSGHRSFSWFRKVNGISILREIGKYPDVSIVQARLDAGRHNDIALEWKRNGYEGPNPFERKATQEPVSVPTFAELVEAYIQNKVRSEANHPEKAEYQIRWMLKRHFEGWLQRKLDRITVEDVLVAKNACGNKHYLANRAIEFVGALYNWSSESSDGRINFWKVTNPATDVECFTEKRRERFLQPDELGRFNEALKTEIHADLKDFLTLAITTAARRSDIFSMRWSDVKWERRVWTVPYPKNAESYDVELLPAALDVLKRRRVQISDSETYVFPGVGRTGHLTDLKKPWIEFRKRAQISDFRLHDLRRTNASYQAIAGVPLQQIGAALGHKSMQSTLVYAKLHTEAVRSARETGQAKMLQMMRAANRRAKLTAGQRKLLPAAGSAT